MSGEQMFKRDRALQEQAVVIPADLAADAERATCLVDAPEGHRYEVALVVLLDGAE